MLYMCKLWKYNREERCYSLVEPVEIVGTTRASELYAESVLPVATETKYRDTWGNHPWVEVVSCRHFKNSIMKKKEYRETDSYKETYETPIDIVPSVGELGYW